MLTANYAGWLNALDMTCFCCCKVTVDVNSQMLSIIGHGGSSKGLKSLIWIRSHGLYTAVYKNWNNKMQLKTVGERVHHSSPSTCVSAVFWDTIVFVYFSWEIFFISCRGSPSSLFLLVAGGCSSGELWRQVGQDLVPLLTPQDYVGNIIMIWWCWNGHEGF